MCLITVVPKFPKEKAEPVVVTEGDSVVLECNPPQGIPPWQLYWMTNGNSRYFPAHQVSQIVESNGINCMHLPVIFLLV